MDKKDDINMNDMLGLTPKLYELMAGYFKYAAIKKLPVKITSIKSDRAQVQAVSKTHEQGRAIDFSTKDWPIDEIHNCVNYLNTHYRHIAAISYSNNEPTAALFHDASYGAHLHLQVRN